MDNPDKNGQPRQEWTTQTRMDNPDKNEQPKQEWTTQTRMDNPDTLTTFSTKDRRRGQTKQNIT
jgi:hypothetical protein